MSELSQFFGAKFSTAILKYPSGRFGLVGSVPAALTHEKNTLSGLQHVSNVYETEQEVINALLGIGITHFQKADCTWFDQSESVA